MTSSIVQIHESVLELISKFTIAQVVEEWRPVVGYEDLYYVSSLGRVLSVRRKIILSQPLSSGYPVVGLRKLGEKKTFYVHRLVALAFIPNPENLEMVDHISGVKTDNNITNLRWIDRSGNAKNQLVKGGNFPTKMGNHYYYRVNYCPQRDGKMKPKLFRIQDPNSEESRNEAYNLAEAYRIRVVSELNNQLPRFQ